MTIRELSDYGGHMCGVYGTNITIMCAPLSLQSVELIGVRYGAVVAGATVPTGICCTGALKNVRSSA